jgi:membrane protein YdbS with pleckstrin-like domain
MSDDIDLMETRGLPAFWSALFAVPFLAAGIYVYEFQYEHPLVAAQPEIPTDAGLILLGFGGFVLALGLYVQFIAAPRAPTMRDDETVIDIRRPAQRGSLARTFASVPFLSAGIYLLYFTVYPYVYPTAALAVGLYLFSSGIYRYWQNTLTTYLVTTERVVEEYRFVSLIRTEVPLDQVKSVQERRSALESLFGLGNVRVSSGASGNLAVTVSDIYDSTDFADILREQL